MFSLALSVGRWVVRRIGWFVLIVATLWAGWLVQGQLEVLADLENNVLYLKSGHSKLKRELNELKEKTQQSVAKLEAASAAQLDQRIVELTKQVESKSQRLRELDGVMTRLNPAKNLDVAGLKIEIGLATQELEHLLYLRGIRADIRAHSGKLGRLAEDCERVRLQHVGEWNAYKAAHARLASLNAANSFHSQWNPLSDGFKKREAFEAARNRHALNTQNLKLQHDRCLASQAATQRVLNGLEKEKVFVLKDQQAQTALSDLDDRILMLQEEATKHWLKPLLLDPLKQIFPVALGILAAAICAPIAIKFCLYFLLAPLAAKQSPICLQPNSRAKKPVGEQSNRSAVSLALEVAPGFELVVQPSYFHSAPERCATTSRFVLNSQFVMTSVAAGMYNLTAVRSDQAFVTTVSSGQDSLSELLKIDIGEEESVCLLPRSLVGVIQRRDSPVRISSHWRLGSMQAWLSFQLRYLVFHGPASIIVKGGRGVRIEPVIEGRAIEQVSTVGFSANLQYSVSRTETFMAYLCGKKGLLRDRFSGQSGFFMYEEMSGSSKRSGVTGKGFEGVADAVLKLFGV